jgi:hypothetical protein
MNVDRRALARLSFLILFGWYFKVGLEIDLCPSRRSTRKLAMSILEPEIAREPFFALALTLWYVDRWVFAEVCAYASRKRASE